MIGNKNLFHLADVDDRMVHIISRLGTRLHFEFMVISKVDTVNDNVVSSGCTIPKQRPWIIHSASVA